MSSVEPLLSRGWDVLGWVVRVPRPVGILPPVNVRPLMPKLSWECRDNEHRACTGRTVSNEPCECECHNDPAPIRRKAYPSVNPPQKEKELVNA